MSLTKIKNMKDKRGFTLVELLIVIVIIAILAAITIVAYNGITSRAHSSAAKQAAQNVANKVEAYNAEEGHYPLTTADLTGAATDKSYNLPATAVDFGNPSANTDDNTVSFTPCPAGATASTITGVKIGYYKYDGSDKGVQYMTSGTCSS